MPELISRFDLSHCALRDLVCLKAFGPRTAEDAAKSLAALCSLIEQTGARCTLIDLTSADLRISGEETLDLLADMARLLSGRLVAIVIPAGREDIGVAVKAALSREWCEVRAFCDVRDGEAWLIQTNDRSAG